MAKRKSRIRNALDTRYKVVVLHEETFEERVSFTGKLWYWITGGVTAAALLIILVILLIRATPLREYVIGAALGGLERGRLVDAYSRIDSMEQLLRANDTYLENLRRVISGRAGETMDSLDRQQQQADARRTTPDTIAGVSEDELALRQLIESGAPYDLTGTSGQNRTGIASYTFYSPVKGILSSEYTPSEQHYAVDIAVKQNEPVRATLSGYVVFASYTPETGYVIIVQHGNNLLSVYKHCASIIKKVGSFVRGGEVIAMAGDTGELSTGPHLHFELWHNGHPVNPTDYIAF